MDNQRLLQYALYGLGAVLWFIIWKFLGSVTELVQLVRHMPQIELPLFGSIHNLYALLALALTAVAVEYTRRNAVTNKFGTEVVGELRKVTWPNWKEVKGTTLVVLGVTFAISLVLFFFDKIYDNLIQLLFKLA